ncbi:MAG: DEAD/DEAH box helicase [Nocardioidaceae bacterium]
MLFSATLDAGVDVIVQRFLHQHGHAQRGLGEVPPVAAMSHHVLHVAADSKVPVLVDLACSRRTLVFTRTKHGAKILACSHGRRGSRAGAPREPVAERTDAQPDRFL